MCYVRYEIELIWIELKWNAMRKHTMTTQREGIYIHSMKYVLKMIKDDLGDGKKNKNKLRIQKRSKPKKC